MSEEYDYRIELEDGVVVETNDMLFAAHTVWPDEPDSIADHPELEPDDVPMQVRADDEPDIDEDGIRHASDRLKELCRAWERKAGNSHCYEPKVRAAYSDAAEKLRAVLNGSSWMESP